MPRRTFELTGRGDNEPVIQVLRMESPLIALRSNELFGSPVAVHRRCPGIRQQVNTSAAWPHRLPSIQVSSNQQRCASTSLPRRSSEMIPQVQPRTTCAATSSNQRRSAEPRNPRIHTTLSLNTGATTHNDQRHIIQPARQREATQPALHAIFIIKTGT